MRIRELNLNLPLEYTADELSKLIQKKTGFNTFHFRLENKSLDARKKSNIHWNLRLLVGKGKRPKKQKQRRFISYKKGRGNAVVVGSGPAGIFSALNLQESGYTTTIVERGSKIKQRIADISRFEKTAVFSEPNNYAFGEGGAGTFSDGKLTSRTKKISDIRQYILEIFVEAGAPDEINYMKHPHIGSDHLTRITKRLREKFLSLGWTIQFDTLFTGFRSDQGKVTHVYTDQGELSADLLMVASGHSAYDTYRLLLKQQVPFRLKNFALGSRVEHRQRFINRAQWGVDELPGVKAAEYRLSSRRVQSRPVYTFCMCPGGKVVPAAAYPDRGVVNGMSLYSRSGEFANAACVAGISLDELLGERLSPADALNWVDDLEKTFFEQAGNYQIPCCSIKEFIDQADPTVPDASSYPLGLKAAALWQILPQPVSQSIREGLLEFSRLIPDYDQGYIMGLESKTSAPIQVIRAKNGTCFGFDNLYLIGEASGLSGGIVSSAADGIRMTSALLN